MRIWKTLMIGVLAALGFALTAEHAEASTITTSGAVFTGVAARTLTLEPNGIAISCDITFGIRSRSTSVTASSLPATIASLGSVTANVGQCGGGWVLTLLDQPWSFDLVVDGASGDVTARSRVVIKNLHLQFSGIPACLFADDVAAAITAAGTGLSVDVRLPLATGPVICPSAFHLQGSIVLNTAMTARLA